MVRKHVAILFQLQFKKLDHFQVNTWKQSNFSTTVEMIVTFVISGIMNGKQAVRQPTWTLQAGSGCGISGRLLSYQRFAQWWSKLRMKNLPSTLPTKEAWNAGSRWNFKDLLNGFCSLKDFNVWMRYALFVSHHLSTVHVFFRFVFPWFSPWSNIIQRGKRECKYQLEMRCFVCGTISSWRRKIRQWKNSSKSQTKSHVETAMVIFVQTSLLPLKYEDEHLISLR